MKKLLLSLGSIAAVVVPVVSVVSCGTSDTTFKADITGQGSWNLTVIKLQEDFGNKISNVKDDTKTIDFDIKCGSDNFKKTLDLDFVRTQGTLPTEFTEDFTDFLKRTHSVYFDAGARSVINEMIGWFAL